jgi:hypothetical protein
MHIFPQTHACGRTPEHYTVAHIRHQPRPDLPAFLVNGSAFDAGTLVPAMHSFLVGYPARISAMSSVAELQRNAEHCFRLAEGARDPHIKASWARLAETWLRLADQENRRSPATRPISRPRAERELVETTH